MCRSYNCFRHFVFDDSFEPAPLEDAESNNEAIWLATDFDCDLCESYFATLESFKSWFSWVCNLADVNVRIMLPSDARKARSELC